MHPRRQFTVKLGEATSAELDQVPPRAVGVTPKPADVDTVADLGERLEQPHPMVKLDGGAVEVSVLEEMVHADTDLQDAFVEMADFTGRRPPEQFERFVLLEELARVELTDRLHQFWRGRLAACRLEVCLFQALQGALELGVS